MNKTQIVQSVLERLEMSLVPTRYVSLEKLAQEIGVKKSLLQRYICEGYLKEGIHFFKPTKRYSLTGGERCKIFFDLLAVQMWIQNKEDEEIHDLITGGR